MRDHFPIDPSCLGGGTPRGAVAKNSRHLVNENLILNWGEIKGKTHNKKPIISDGLLIPAFAERSLILGNVLLSHTVTHAVPSALKGLTSVFGMGTGVSPPPWSPRNFLKIRCGLRVLTLRAKPETRNLKLYLKEEYG